MKIRYKYKVCSTLNELSLFLSLLLCLNYKFCFKQDLGLNKVLVSLLSFVFNGNWSFTFGDQHEKIKIACRCVWKQHENRLADFKSLIIFLKIKRSIESTIGVLSQIFCLFCRHVTALITMTFSGKFLMIVGATCRFTWCRGNLKQNSLFQTFSKSAALRNLEASDNSQSGASAHLFPLFFSLLFGAHNLSGSSVKKSPLNGQSSSVKVHAVLWTPTRTAKP